MLWLPLCRYVLMQAAPVGAVQVLHFQRLLGGGVTLDTNARPAQAMNARSFDYESSGAADGDAATQRELSIAQA